MAKNAIRLDSTEATKRIEKHLRHLSKSEIARANVAALKRAGRAAMAAWRRESSALVTAKTSDVGQAFKAKLPKPASQVYELIVKGDKVLPISKFKNSQAKTGVKTKIWKSGASRIISGAFLVDRFGKNAFTREGKARGPLKMLYGPSTKMLAKKTSHVVAKQFDDVYAKRIIHELDYRIQRANK